MKRPIYTPKEKIESSLYTRGKEWMTTDFKEYIGLYHRYPNNAVYSEPTFLNQSIELIPFAPPLETENDGIYFKLTGTRFNNYIAPKYYYPIVTDEDYITANITRYFVQRKNNYSYIIEIDSGQFEKINNDNEEGIDAGVYNKGTIQWSISGPRDTVQEANQRVISLSNLQGLDVYLTDLTEFYK